MNHADDKDFNQFRGAFNDVQSPSAEFSERMKKLLARETENAHDKHKTTVIASPSRQGAVMPSGRRRNHPLAMVASVLVVFAVVVSSILVLGDFSLEGDYASAPSGEATLPANAVGTPGADVQLDAELVIPNEADSDGRRWTLAVIDGVIYTSHSGPASSDDAGDVSTNYVTAWDAETGEQLWELEGYQLYDLAVSNGVLMAMRDVLNFASRESVAQAPLESRSIVALDPSTGELLWEQSVPIDQSMTFNERRLVVIDDLVVSLGEDGNLIGLNLRTGEETWTTSYDRGEGFPTEYQTGNTTVSTTMYTVVAVAWNGHVVVVNGDGLVQLIDAGTGKTISTSQVDTNPVGHMGIDIHSVPEGILISTAGGPSQLIMINPETDELLWEREFEGQLQTYSAENGLIGVSVHNWESGSFIMQLIGRGGHSTFNFYWFDGATGEELLVTDRGRVDGPAFAKPGDSYLCTMGEEFVCYDRAGTRYLIQHHPVFDAFLYGDVLYFNDDEGLYRVTLP